MSIPDPVVLLDARAKYVHPAFQMGRASTKTVFDSTGRLVTVPANAIGWDHVPATGQARGYLAEPSATNLLLHSNDLTQSPWVAFASSVTGDAITGPDGNGMAKLVENSADSAHSIFQEITIGDGDALSVSLIAKAAERDRLRILFRQTSNAANTCRLDSHLSGDGIIVALADSGDATVINGGVTHLGGGFYHAWLVGTLNAGVTDARFSLGILDSNGNTLYQGDGTSGLYLGYCQAEVGAYPTSYIETGAATATRAIERLTLPSITTQPWWRNDQWSMVLEYHNRGFELGAETLSNRILSFGNFSFIITYASSGMLRSRGSILTSANNAFIQSADAQVLRRNLIAFAISDDGFQAAANGALTSTDTVTGQLDDLELTLGASPNGVYFAASTGNYRLSYYPARLSNAALQSLTAMQE